LNQHCQVMKARFRRHYKAPLTLRISVCLLVQNWFWVTHLFPVGATSSFSVLVTASSAGFGHGCSMSSVRPKQSSSTNRAEAEGRIQYLRYIRSLPRGSRQVQAAALWSRSWSSRTCQDETQAWSFYWHWHFLVISTKKSWQKTTPTEA